MTRKRLLYNLTDKPAHSTTVRESLIAMDGLMDFADGMACLGVGTDAIVNGLISAGMNIICGEGWQAESAIFFRTLADILEADAAGRQ